MKWFRTACPPVWLQPWMARASTVLPVPLGPRSKTTASEAATCRASSMARCMPGYWELNDTSGCNRSRSSFKCRYALLHAANGRHSFGDQLNLFRGKGLGNVIGRAPPHGFDRGVDGSISRDDNDLDPGASAENWGNQVESILRAQPQIHKRQVKDLSVGLCPGVLSIAYGGHAMAARLQADR